MGKSRGYILVLLVAIWATLPALASLCPKELPPCCRGMREMCCMSMNASAANLCCPMHMHKGAASPAAVVNSTDNAAHAVPLMMLSHLDVKPGTRNDSMLVEVASSPPISADRSSSILRI